MKEVKWYIDPPMGDTKEDKTYYERHRDTDRVHYALWMLEVWKDCKSVIDVGCKSLNLLERAPEHYTEKLQIDYNYPGFLNPAIPFQMYKIIDLHDYPQYDVVVCMEVLEHIPPDMRRVMAACLIRMTKKHLMVSIPYGWKGTTEVHDHNGINDSNVMEWFYPYKWDCNQHVGGRKFYHFDKD